MECSYNHDYYVSASGFTLTLQETRSIHDSMNRPKMNLLLIFTFNYQHLKHKNFRKQNSFVFIFVIMLLNGFVRVLNGKAEQPTRTRTRTANGANKKCFARATPVLLAIKSQHHAVSLLANEFDVRSVLYGQVRLAAVNQICGGHKAIKGCKNLKIN